MSSTVGRGNLGGILRDNLGEGKCDSKIAARQWGVNFCREASRCLAGPSGESCSENGLFSPRAFLTAGFLYRAGAETPLNF